MLQTNWIEKGTGPHATHSHMTIDRGFVKTKTRWVCLGCGLIYCFCQECGSFIMHCISPYVVCIFGDDCETCNIPRAMKLKGKENIQNWRDNAPSN